MLLISRLYLIHFCENSFFHFLFHFFFKASSVFLAQFIVIRGTRGYCRGSLVDSARLSELSLSGLPQTYMWPGTGSYSRDLRSLLGSYIYSI